MSSSENGGTIRRVPPLTRFRSVACTPRGHQCTFLCPFIHILQVDPHQLAQIRQCRGGAASPHASPPPLVTSVNTHSRRGPKSTIGSTLSTTPNTSTSPFLSVCIRPLHAEAHELGLVIAEVVAERFLDGKVSVEEVKRFTGLGDEELACDTKISGACIT